MVVLNVTYKCKPNMKEDFLKAIKSEGIDTACRNEDGNIKYDYYFPVDEDDEMLTDEMLLVEKWRDADALDAHTKQPHFARLGELKNEYVEETIIEKY